MKSGTTTPRQHALLIFLLLAGGGLVLYSVKDKQIDPRILSQKRSIAEQRLQIDHLETQLAAREAMDLPAMRAAVAEARERLRTVEIAGVDDGAPFLDVRLQPEVAAFQANLSRRAVESQLAIQRHSAVEESDPRFEGLVIRELEVHGRFQHLLRFIGSLHDLPHRLVVLSLDLQIDTERPGQLRTVLRYSL